MAQAKTKYQEWVLNPIYKYNIIKVKGDKRDIFSDTLIREINLKILVNGTEIASLMATPVDLKELAVGYLMSENILANIEDIKTIKLASGGEAVEIDAVIDEDAVDRLDTQSVVVSGCGRSRTANTDIDAISARINNLDFEIKTSKIVEQMDGFLQHCRLYQQTGCVHTAKLYMESGEYFVAEDIAQHNTMDKVIAKAKFAGVDTAKSVLLVSGRLSSEMVAKAVIHEIPILVSRTASTSLGVQIADKFGLTLVGFVRGDRMNIYTNEYRIKTGE